MEKTIKTNFMKNRKMNNFIWNIIGSLSNAATTVILLIIVTNLNGNDDGGIISISFATAQLMFTIGGFEVRAYQTTDVKNKFKFKEYYTFRIITCIIMMVLSIIYICARGYSGQKAIVIVLMCFYYMIDALADVFEGLFQIKERLDMSGKSLAIRVILSTIAFALVLYFTGDLVMASIANCIVSVIWLYIYDIRLAKHYEKATYYFNYKKIKSLFFECLPLFAGSFMLMYIINAPKYAIDRYMTLEMQNYYNIIAMPSAVINLFSIFLFRPLLTTLANNYANKNKKKFISIICLLIGWVLFLTLCAVILAYLIGIPILSMIFTVDLTEYRNQLIILMIAGGSSALTTVLYYVLTVMRKQYSILSAYVIAFIVTIAITPVLVRNYGVLGASISYCIVMTILAVIFIALSIINTIKNFKNNVEIKIG